MQSVLDLQAVSDVHVTVTSLSGELLVQDRFPRPRLLADVKQRLLCERDKVFTLLRGTEELTEASVVDEDRVALVAVAQQLSDEARRACLESLSGWLGDAWQGHVDGPPLRGFSDLALHDDEVIATAVRAMDLLMSLDLLRALSADAFDPVKDNRKFMLQLAATYPRTGHVHVVDEALRHASDRLRDDKEFMTAVVKQRGRNVQFASNRLRDDVDVVQAAIESEAHMWESRSSL